MQSLGIELPYYLRYFNMADDFAGGINNETMYKDEYKPWKPEYNKETFQHYDFNIYIKPNAHISTPDDMYTRRTSLLGKF